MPSLALGGPAGQPDPNPETRGLVSGQEFDLALTRWPGSGHLKGWWAGPTLRIYKAIINVINIFYQCSIDSDKDLHLFNSKLFSRLFSQNNIISDNAFITFLKILKKLQFHWIINVQIKLNNNKKSIFIKEQIFRYKIIIINIEMNSIQLIMYIQIHQNLIRNLKMSEVKTIFVKK